MDKDLNNLFNTKGLQQQGLEEGSLQYSMSVKLVWEYYLKKADEKQWVAKAERGRGKRERKKHFTVSAKKSLQHHIQIQVRRYLPNSLYPYTASHCPVSKISS